MSKLNLFLAVLMLSLASLACTMFVGGPDYPEGVIPVSTEQVAILEGQIESAITQGMQSGTITLTINESQLTSLLAVRLQQDENPIIQEPQVYLRNGEIQVYGKAIQGNFQVNIGIVITTNIDANGSPVLTVKSVDFGPLPAPEGINSAINALVAEAFTGALGPAAIGFRLETITIADGVMTLTGRVK